MSTTMYSILSALGGLGCIILGKLLERRKNNAEAAKLLVETEGQELDNASKAVKIWRELYETLQRTVGELRNEVIELRQENATLKKQIDELTKLIQPKN